MNDNNQAFFDATKRKQTAVNSWQAILNLDFAFSKARTVLAKRQHIGPLVIQKALYPEGQEICHGIIVHPPGGVAGGDGLSINLQLGSKAKVLLTSPGATKWYKSNGSSAKQHLNFKIENAACLEWLPQENILFDSSNVGLASSIELDEKSVYAGWEIVCFGRQAQKESWLSGELRQNLRIKRKGKLIWQECTAINSEHQVFDSMAGLGSRLVHGSFVIAARKMPDEILKSCREVCADQDAKTGVTALPEIFSARYVGYSSQAARSYFESIWQIARPWYLNRKAARPRIWNT